MAHESMTQKVAIAVLIQAAESYLRGAGQGIRESATKAERERIVAAARRVWTKAYNFNPPSDWPQ